MDDTTLLLNLSTYIWSAVFFTIFTAKCFFSGWTWRPFPRRIKPAETQSGGMQHGDDIADVRGKLSLFRAAAILLISPSMGYVFPFLLFESTKGFIIEINGIRSITIHALCSVAIQLVVHLVLMGIYVKLVHAVNASMAMFLYLCSVMLVPGFYYIFSVTSNIPLLCYIGLHVLFYRLTVIPASKMTGSRQKTNTGLFVALPAATYLFNTLMYAIYACTQSMQNEILPQFSVLRDVKKMMDEELYERYFELIKITIAYIKYQQNVLLYPSIFIVVVLIIAFSVIMGNIRYMNQTLRAQEDLKTLSVEVMEALAHTIDAKDEYTRGHSIRVATYARMIAEKMGYDKERCETIYYMGLLHDIGKIGVPNAIINKPSRLTDEEYSVIKKHPMTGNDILKEIKSHPELATGARWHHERYDGKGYPDHKAGDEIPVEARIIAVADTYDAMTSNRSYRSYLPQKVVREEIEKNIGTQFDEAPARCMIRIIDEDTEYVLHE